MYVVISNRNVDCKYRQKTPKVFIRLSDCNDVRHLHLLHGGHYSHLYLIGYQSQYHSLCIVFPYMSVSIIIPNIYNNECSEFQKKKHVNMVTK